MKITLEEIKDGASSQVVYECGRKYYNEDRVFDLKVSHMDEYMEIYGHVVGHMGEYRARAELYHERISWCECDCISSFEHEGACKHVVALLLKYYYELLPGLKNSLSGERYTQKALSYYEEQIIREQDLEIGDYPMIRVKPRLIEEVPGSFSLSLSVGENKFYIVKDLYEFAENIMQGNNYSYGKNLEFIHDINVFEVKDRPIVSYILDKTSEYLDILRQVGMYRGFTKADRKTLPLGSKAFDEFFDLIVGTTIEVVREGKTSSVLCVVGNPKVTISVKQEDELYEVIPSIEDYVPMQFANNQYMILDDRIYRLEKQFAQDVFPLLNYMYEAKRVNGTRKLVFDETLMKRFMLSSLEKIEKHITVTMSDEIKTAVVPERVHIKTYLDMDAEGSIIGDVKFEYKAFSFNPYEKHEAETQKILDKLARDTTNEYRLASILKNYDFRTYNGHIYLKEEESIYKFLKQGISDLMSLGEVHVTDKLKGMHIVKSPVGALGIKIENNMLSVALQDVNMPMEEIQEVLNSYRLKNKYYRLKNGSFIDMEDGAIRDLANIVEGLGISKQELEQGEAKLPKYRALYLDQILRQSEEVEATRDKYFKQIIRDVRAVEDADFEVPSTIQATLRGYQKTGYRWLKTMSGYGFGGILADDMGLGKTLQVITLMASEREEVNDESRKPSLVVCPTSLALNWQSEIQKFAPQLKVLVIMGNIGERKALLEQANEVDVVVTSYELLKRDIESYSKLHFKYCIADEAQYIKNANTLSAKTLKLIKSEVQFALTGTPIENSLAELWSIFDFIMPGYLFSYSQFKRNFEMPIVKNQDEETTNRLKKMIGPFIMRRLKKDVLKELPDKIETVIYNTMEDMQQKLYKAHLAEAKAEMEREINEKGVGKSHIKMLSLLTRLRQLCCHPALYLQDYKEGSGKLAQCLEIIRDSIAAGHKILLFSQFTSMLEIIGNNLTLEGINYFVLTGSTKAEERMRLVAEFNASQEVPIFLISLKAGGTGLNLTGADVVIHYDPWWNLSSQNQATDRAYRIGQKNNVQVLQMITKDSIEEKIKELQDKKIGLTESVLQEGEAFISQMSEEEIKELFS